MRLINKIGYILLLTSLNLGYMMVYVLIALHWLLPKAGSKRDVIFFPYYPEGNIGYSVRFESYFPSLKRDQIDFKMMNTISHDRYLSLQNGSVLEQYFLYHLIFWKRLFQTWEARKFKTAFVQRTLFPFYPDTNTPHLEIFLRKLTNQTTLDYWDSVWLNNEKIIDKTIKYFDTISVVNEFIRDYFSSSTAKKILFPIGIDMDRYEVKENYKIGERIKLFYTGSPSNLEVFGALISPILTELSKTYSIQLVVVSKGRLMIEHVDIIHYDFDETTFYSIMQNCDIGLYAIDNTDVSRGKMAMKTLDYMACGLPSVVSPIGLSSFAEHENNALFANSQAEWIDALKQMIDDDILREKIGRSGRETIEKHHNIHDSYQLLRKITGF